MKNKALLVLFSAILVSLLCLSAVYADAALEIEDVKFGFSKVDSQLTSVTEGQVFGPDYAFPAGMIIRFSFNLTNLIPDDFTEHGACVTIRGIDGGHDLQVCKDLESMQSQSTEAVLIEMQVPFDAVTGSYEVEVYAEGVYFDKAQDIFAFTMYVDSYIHEGFLIDSIDYSFNTGLDSYTGSVQDGDNLFSPGFIAGNEASFDVQVSSNVNDYGLGTSGMVVLYLMDTQGNLLDLGSEYLPFDNTLTEHNFNLDFTIPDWVGEDKSYDVKIKFYAQSGFADLSLINYGTDVDFEVEYVVPQDLNWELDLQEGHSKPMDTVKILDVEITNNMDETLIFVNCDLVTDLQGQSNPQATLDFQGCNIIDSEILPLTDGEAEFVIALTADTPVDTYVGELTLTLKSKVSGLEETTIVPVIFNVYSGLVVEEFKQGVYDIDDWDYDSVSYGETYSNALLVPANKIKFFYELSNEISLGESMDVESTLTVAGFNAGADLVMESDFVFLGQEQKFVFFETTIPEDLDQGIYEAVFNAKGIDQDGLEYETEFVHYIFVYPKFGGDLIEIDELDLFLQDGAVIENFDVFDGSDIVSELLVAGETATFEIDLTNPNYEDVNVFFSLLLKSSEEQELFLIYEDAELTFLGDEEEVEFFIQLPTWFQDDVYDAILYVYSFNDDFEDIFVETVEFTLSTDVNNAPVIEVVTALPEPIYAGDVVNFGVEASDVDLDTLTYVWYVNDQLFNDANLESLDVGISQAGDYVVDVTVSDGIDTDQYEWSFTALEAPSVPLDLVVAGLDSVILDQGSSASDEFTVIRTEALEGVAVSCSVSGLSCSVEPSSFDASSQEQALTLTVNAGVTAEVKDYDVNLQFTKLGYVSQVETVVATVNNVGFSTFEKVTQSPTSVMFDQSGTLTLVVKNSGDAEGTLTECSVSNLVKNNDSISLSNCVLPTSSVSVSGTAQVKFDYSVGTSIEEGTYAGTVTLTDSNGQTYDMDLSLVADEGELIIKSVHLYIDGDKETVDDGETVNDNDLKPGVDLEFEILVDNLFDSSNEFGEIDDIEVFITIKDIDDGSDYEDDDKMSNLDAGKDDDVKFSYKIDEDTSEDKYKVEIHVEGRDEDDNLLEDYFEFEIDVDRESDDLVITSMKLIPDELGCTETTTLEVTLKNQGSNKLRNVFLTLESNTMGLNKKISVGTMDDDPDKNSNEVTKTITINKVGKSVGDHIITAKGLFDFTDLADIQQSKLKISNCVVSGSDSDSTDSGLSSDDEQNNEDTVIKQNENVIVISAPSPDGGLTGYDPEIVPSTVQQQDSSFSDFRNSDTYFIILAVLMVLVAFGIIAGLIVVLR
jgi:hypothetical protein